MWAWARALKDFAKDVETQIQGLNADIDTRTLAGGAKINRLFYNEFADSLSLVSSPTLVSNLMGIRVVTKTNMCI